MANLIHLSRKGELDCLSSKPGEPRVYVAEREKDDDRPHRHCAKVAVSVTWEYNEGWIRLNPARAEAYKVRDMGF